MGRCTPPSCSWWPTALPRRTRSILPTPSITTWRARTGQINDLGINTGGVIVHVNGTYAMNGPQTTLALHLAAPNLPINQVEALLPAVGVRLPSGSSLQGGTLTANLSHHRTGHCADHQRPGSGGQHPAGRLRSLFEDWRTEAGFQIPGRHADPDPSRQRELVAPGHAHRQSLHLGSAARHGHRRRHHFSGRRA